MTLHEPITLLILLTAATLPGALATLLCGKRPADDALEFVFASLSLGLLLLGWPAFLLAELGGFSLAALLGVWGLVTLSLSAFWLVRRQRRPADNGTGDRNVSEKEFDSTVALTPKDCKSLTEAEKPPQPLESQPLRGLLSFRRRLLSRPRPGVWVGAVGGQDSINRWEIVALGIWLVVASWLFFRPHEFVIGGADAGVYVNLGANIAKTGRILITDPLLAALSPDQYPAWLRAMPRGEAAPYYLLPGFYVTGAPPGQIIPQFYHLHPVWQAVGYALGGLRLELLMTPLWGLLGCLAVYMTVRSLWGWQVGLLALFGLSATALQVWFARYPTAEMLTQYLLWTGGWALSGWLDGRLPRGFWALIAGLALGQVFLTRIDTYVLLIVPFAVGLWLTWTRPWRRADLWFFVPFALLAAHSVVHGMAISRPYFVAQIGTGASVARPLLPLAGAFLGMIVLGALLARRGEQSRARVRLHALCSAFLWLAAGAVLALAAYAYFLRPRLTDPRMYAFWYGGGQVPNLDHENLVRLGWYLTPLGLGMAAAGIALMLVREANRRTAFMLGTGLFFSFIFLWHIGANPHQVYAMRRYVPYVLPFCVVAAAYLIQWLARRLRGKMRWLAAGLTTVWIVGILASSRGFVSQVDYGGFITQLDRLNASLAPRSVLIFNDPAPVGMGDFVGTPLRFLYGHDVLVLRDPDALSGADFAARVAEWQAQGRAVYWVAVAGGHPWPARELDLLLPQEQALTGVVLEGSYEHKPQQIVPFAWPLTIARVSDAARP